jgi:hypothetical protein
MRAAVRVLSPKSQQVSQVALKETIMARIDEAVNWTLMGIVAAVFLAGLVFAIQHFLA